MRDSKTSLVKLLLFTSLSTLGCSSGGSSMTLTSPSFQAGQEIPAEFTCDGKAFGDGTSPALAWSGAPAGTLSFAILLKDLTIESGQSAGDMNPEHPYHWTIWNIPGTTTSLAAALPSAMSPIAGTQQQNGGPPFLPQMTYGYFGPCPNLNAAGMGAAVETHNDAFILYAFSAATLTAPVYNPGTGTDPLNYVHQLADFYEGHPNLLGKAQLSFTSDATPTSCPGFPNPPFTCAPPTP
jgi:phosphatidylethanolamine-binding protein (PEBP) family uncharacterized protein